MLITLGELRGVPLGKSKLLFWSSVAAILLVKFWIVPMIPTLAVADFVTRYIPISLAPVNWVLGLALLAICFGPVMMPKYLSYPLSALCVICVLFFLGTWRYHPAVSPVIAVLSYIELNWLIPWWKTKWIGGNGQTTFAGPTAATILKIALLADGQITMNGSPTTIDSLRASLKRVAHQKGVVWYYREAGQDPAPPIYAEIMSAVIENHLPIRLSSRPDYSDAIGSDGRPQTA